MGGAFINKKLKLCDYQPRRESPPLSRTTGETMTETEKQDFKEYLRQYTKEEIINAVADYHARLEFSGLRELLKSQKETCLFEKMQRASKEDDEARIAFTAYELELSQKYGDGNRFPIVALTREEQNKYGNLYNTWKAKEHQWIKASKEYDKFVGI